MGTTTGPEGIQVTAPDIVDVRFDSAPSAERRGPVLTRGPVDLTSPSAQILDGALLDALAGQGLPLVQTVQLAAGAEMVGRRSLPSDATARLSVPIGPDEDAVVLLEQQEVYGWSIPVTRTDAPPAMRRTGAVGQATFEIPLGAVVPDQSGRRFLGGALLAPIRAMVFRFVGRRVVEGAVRLQESGIQPGLVRLAGHDPSGWVTGPAITLPSPQTGGRHRVLLLVHGTFSSTGGGFGQLGPTAWGRAFLDACYARYDAVLGYDHRTLSESPDENAIALLAALRDLDWGGTPPEIDLVAHSRGGLVARSLIEARMPASGWGASFRRAILVAATNGGTLLAEPDNWKAFLDLYTNLAVAACRALTLLPQAAPVATILGRTIATLGAFVKQIPAAGLDPAFAPGLYAMTPGNPFLRDLNDVQPGQFAAADSIYHVVSSSFAPTLFGGEHQPREFPLRFVEILGENAVTQLMKGAENDLVVDTPSMSAIDAAHGNFVRDTLHFAASPQIYHTNYFARPEVVNALTRWLDLTAAPSVPVQAVRRGGRRPQAAAPLPQLGLRRSDVPASVDTDIVVADPARPAPDLLKEIAAKSPSFVVLESKAPGGGSLSHVFDASELTATLGAATGSASQVLSLPDRGGDAVVPVDVVARETERGRSVFPSGLSASLDRPNRLVVATEAGPVGVVPNAAEVVLDADIGALSRRMAASTDRVLTRRAMPTFTRRLEQTDRRLGQDVREAADAAPKPAAPKPAAPRPDTPAPEATAKCHILAETAPKVKLKSTLTVRVAVSRESIAATTAMADQGTTEVDPERPIVINVWPKLGFTFAEDEEPAEILLPPAGKVEEAYFSLRAEAQGKGEIWVVARQGKLPLLTLKLYPEVVAAKARKLGSGRLKAEALAPQSRGPAPTHTLTIIELERTQAGTVFRFEFNSPVLDKLSVYKSEIRGDREAYANGLYAEIEDFWTGSQRQADIFNAKLRDFGARLFKRLLPDKLQADLWQYRESIDSILVLSEEPFIPWEMLFLVEPGKIVSDEGRFLAELGLVRWLYDAGQPPIPLTIRKGRARFLIPDYPIVPGISLKPLPEATAEADFLVNAYAATRVDPTSAAVTALLRGPASFDLLHFAGHGAAAQGVVDEARVMLSGEIVGQKYVAEYLEADHVENNADLGSGHPIVVLNACQAGRADWRLTGLGGFAQAFLTRGAGLFVGTLWSVGDAPARVFTESFYSALNEGLSVGEAARKARAAAKADKADPTWLAYAVYGHPGASLTRVDF